MSDPHYHINLFWSKEDNLWIADVPDLKGCSAHGHSPLEAVEQVRDAIEGWIETAREIGLDVPEPRYSPAIYAVRNAA
ncbi:MAG: type II toxin-antitoxin system HicB family antitoxin [Sphingomicrobium sp.]